MSEIKHILSVIHDDWENIYFVLLSSSNRKYELLYPMFRVRSGNNGVRGMSLYILAVYKVLARSVSGNRLLGLWYQICMIRCMTSNACNFHINSIVIYNSWYLKNLPSLHSKDSTDFAETTCPGRTFHTSTILLKKTQFFLTFNLHMCLKIFSECPRVKLYDAFAYIRVIFWDRIL